MQTLSVDKLVGQVLGSYRVERFLGKGRLNAVYLARQLASRRLDALALYLVPEQISRDARTRFLTRFRKEAAAITTLAHPYILPVYEYGEFAGYPYLVTPYMTNGSLTDLLKKNGRCEYTFVGAILAQVVAGLEYAHQKGFIHGTLKPANIVVNEEESMLVAGFGLMHMLQASGIEQKATPYAHLLTITGTFLAHPEYIAPEVVCGQSIDRRSDIYSLGCILFELLSGCPPFVGDKPLEVARKHVTQNVPSLRSFNPDIPVVLEAVIHHALERDPARRFQSIGELGEAFIQATKGATSFRLQALQPTRHSTQELEAILRSEPVQETPREGYPTGNWQLIPPIITGRMPIVAGRSDEKDAHSASALAGSADSTCLGQKVKSSTVPQASGSVVPPTSPTLPPVFAREPDFSGQTALADSSFVGSPEDLQELAKKYAWWSQSDQLVSMSVEGEKPQAISTLTGEKSPAVKAWSMEELNLDPSTHLQATARRPRKMKRRHVVALLATGGTIIAGALLVPDLERLVGKVPSTTQQKGTSPHMVPTGNNNAAQQTKGTIGSTALAKNSAMDFTNPADSKMSLLVHLPGGNFVAYEKACTHEGVSVHYDPGTGMLVCPAHGAIFDPANAGKVVQGPAVLPLPTVKIQIHGDGSVTAL